MQLFRLSVSSRQWLQQHYPRQRHLLAGEGRKTNHSVLLAAHITAVLSFPLLNHLVDLMVKVSASRAADPGFDSGLRSEDFSGSSHTSDSKIGTVVATLPGALLHTVRAGASLPGLSIL